MGEAKKNEESKAEAFKSDPERFVDKRDIVFAAVLQKDKNGNGGIGYLVNNGMTNNSYIISLHYIDKQVKQMMDMRKVMEDAEAAKKNPGIITP